ncbi:Outer membrane protein IcsA autotransporter precursor [Pragia fontium]|uniref:autotransporter outer membrane beta-barrel domain-containing protein n=1 Tax=Pragia fontium TaxID=82985 RepID=UPI000E081647|nr:autotransporter outer membrane beta-barrel domain-containing protein [Pragia fontium]SUB80893.1 Outer membrane protein IcsA autotransporter precursor [Pragia fontium]
MPNYLYSKSYKKTLLAITTLSVLYSAHSQAVTCDAGIICNAPDAYVDSAIADGAGSELIFTAPDVYVDRIYNGLSGIVAKNNAKITFEGNASVIPTDPSGAMSANTAINITDGAHVTVKDSLSVAVKPINGSPAIINLNNGKLTIGKDLTIQLVAAPNTSGKGLYLDGNSELTVGGKAHISNDQTGSRTMNISIQGSSTAKFNQLYSMTVGHVSTIINSTASLISEGETRLENLSDGDALWLNGQGLVSIGDTQAVADEMVANRAGIAQLNVGSKATIKSNDGIAIGILSGSSDSITTIKGSVISDDYAYAAFGSKTHALNIVGGSVKGSAQFSSGNDRFTMSSGIFDGDIYMLNGDDYLEITGGKIIGSIFMDEGHNSALIADNADISELEALEGSTSDVASPLTSGKLTLRNIDFSGDTVDDNIGIFLSNWDNLSLENNANMTITSHDLAIKSEMNIDSTSTLQAADGLHNINLATVDSVVNNSGHIKIANNTVGESWRILGNYHGDNGLISINTVLNGDDSLTDKLSIEGDTSGLTYVKVDNVGGVGALTAQGIEIITVGGESDGEFKKMANTRIVAGLYEYDLVKKDKNWYLTSELESPLPTKPEITPPAPEVEHVYRPESGSYMANHIAANSLFINRLHDRLGETQYTDVLTGEKKVTSMWMRNVGGHNRSRDASGQLKTQSNRYVLQIGGDIAQWSTDGLDRWHLGLMTGYANHQSNTRSKASGYSSEGTVKGYHAGVYGTWYANDSDKNGTYLDSWAIYNWFDNEVKGESLSSEKYKSRGVTASVEAGYTFNLGGQKANGVTYYLQPKAQAIWMNVRANNHTESNGTRVSFDGDGNIQTRLGLRAYMKGHSDIDAGKDREFEPFIEANWIHNTNNFGVSMNNVSNEIRGTQNIGELKLGVEGQLSKQVNMWGNVAQQVGDDGYSDTQLILGVKYSF